MAENSITKDMGEFSAAHQLPWHGGGCKNLHGHNYRVEIEVTGLIRAINNVPDSGMIIDFGVIKDIYKERVHSVVDHALILGTVPLPWYKTLELMAESQGEDDQQDSWLGRVAHLPIPVTTAEHIARWIWSEMSEGLQSFVEENPRQEGMFWPYISAVTVWETASSSATLRHTPNVSRPTITPMPPRPIHNG